MSFDSETPAHRRIQRYHAMNQCLLRYGWYPDHNVYALICDQVWSAIYGTGSDRVEQVGPKRTGRFFVRIQGAWVLVAWSDVTLQIATFLPLTCELSDRPVEDLELTPRT